jgi:hypothetical protein
MRCTSSFHLPRGQFLRRRVRGVLRVDLVHFGRDRRGVDAEVRQDLRGHAALRADQGLQQVVAAHRGVARQRVRRGHDLLRRVRAGRGFAARVFAEPFAEQVVDRRADGAHVVDLPGQDLRGHAVALAFQRQQDVFGADVVVLELHRFPQ